ncbi:spore protease YyaC [uncultured Robinsoniella sp.]|uniref:spore protease YyaC n=1 Tax=uncultured Robinsoniella sp. TaxID=904190 RepID=UPI00374F872B
MHSDSLKKTHYINSKEKNAPIVLGEHLLDFLQSPDFSQAPPVFVCIGSDRVTGDSLGPLIGSRLKKQLGRHFAVYGTLDSPIHALNLDEAILNIKKRHSNNTIIAIDASLGTKRHQGYISIGKGSLLPGAGVEKKLNAVGDVFITGIINTAGRFAHLALQTTRLSTVMHLADCMIDGILLACRYYTLDTDSLETLWDFDDLYSPMPALAPTTGATLDAN